MEKKMRKKNNYRKRKLKPKIRLCIFIILIILTFNFINNVLKSSNASRNIVTEKENLPVTNDTKENNQQIAVFPSDVYGVQVKSEIIDKETKARSGEKRIIKYIVIHETDNFEKGTTAANHAMFLKENNTSSTSWNYTVDDKEIYHHIPDDEKANHAGEHNGNEYGIGIELCVNKEGNFEKTFDNATKLVAYLLKSYDLEIEAVKTHHDFSGKDCPHKILKNNRLEEFKKKVKYYLKL